jgi:hypothetical protein
MPINDSTHKPVNQPSVLPQKHMRDKFPIKNIPDKLRRDKLEQALRVHRR